MGRFRVRLEILDSIKVSARIQVWLFAGHLSGESELL